MCHYRCTVCKWSGDDREKLLVCPECSSNQIEEAEEPLNPEVTEVHPDGDVRADDKNPQ